MLEVFVLQKRIYFLFVWVGSKLLVGVVVHELAVWEVDVLEEAVVLEVLEEAVVVEEAVVEVKVVVEDVVVEVGCS